jgi:hypothetical protein
MPSIFVLNVPEFLPLVTHAKAVADWQVHGPHAGYWRIHHPHALRFERKALGFKPAVWHGALTGGLQGRITHFDNDQLVIEGDAP